MKRSLFYSLLLLSIFMVTACGKDRNFQSSDINNQTEDGLDIKGQGHLNGGENSSIEYCDEAMENYKTGKCNVPGLDVDGDGVIETTDDNNGDGKLDKDDYIPHKEKPLKHTGNNYTDNRAQNGMIKVYSLITAYDSLLSQKNGLNWQIQSDIEKGTRVTRDFLNEGIFEGNFFKVTGVIINYYWDFINENKVYKYEIFERRDFTNEELLKHNPVIESRAVLSEEIIMYEAIRAVKYLKECESIQCNDLIESNKYKFTDGSVSSYYIELNCDGLGGLYAVFDKDGNLLSIEPDEDWRAYKYTDNYIGSKEGM